MKKYAHLREKARELRHQGATLTEICEQLALGKSTVHGWIKDIPIPQTARQTEQRLRASHAISQKHATLREQWYKNNLFDNAVLSKRRFYKGGISLNGTSVGNFSLRAFNISTDSFGFQKIVSVPQPEFANVSVFEGDIGAVPIPLNSDNSSFAYSYEVNLTAPYSGIGKNNLSLSLSDDFGFAFTTEKEILSRAMTFDGNKSEAGNLVSGDTTNYGKSAKFEFDNFNVGILSLGTIGIILVVALFAKKH